MRIVVYFSAFDYNEENNYIVKELAIVHIDTNTFQSWILFKSFPSLKLIPSLRYANDYLSQHVLGLEWLHGEVEYGELKNILQSIPRTVLMCTHTEKQDSYFLSPFYKEQ